MENQASLNPSLLRKSAARVAAVQALYTKAMTGERPSPARQIAALKKELANNKDEQKLRAGMAVEPNYTLLEALLTGVAEWLPEIDKRLDSTLTSGWKRERMSPLLLAILQCGIFELFFHKDAKPALIIDEYTRIARSFFAENEVNFAHAALIGLSQRYHG